MRQSAVGLEVAHFGQEVRRILRDEREGAAADGKFDGRQQRAKTKQRAARQEDEVHVFGHEDICPQVERMIAARAFQRLGQPEAGPLAAQKRLAAKAGECKRVGGRRVVGTARNLRMRPSERRMQPS
ncbi:MAG: hypothetical protein U1D55_18785 [Phycisphaerae bacterium]